MNWETLLNQLRVDFCKPYFQIQRKRYNGKTSAGLTEAIIDFIDVTGGDATRRFPLRKRCIVGWEIRCVKIPENKALGGVCATYRSRKISIEVRIGDEQSEAQRREQERIQSLGGLYFVAKDMPSFIKWYAGTFPTIEKKISSYGYTSKRTVSGNKPINFLNKIDG